jgi:hypothetical protein
MYTGAKSFLAMALLVLAAGCHPDRPHDYGDQRPDIDSLDDRDSGLQSKDVVTASDQMARDILASPLVRQNPTQLTVVPKRLEDHTIDHRGFTNYDIFLARLRSNLAMQGSGQVTILENKAKLANTRNEELDNERDDFQQGGGQRPLGRIQPNYALNGKVFDLPNRGTNYYFLEFNLVDIRTGVIAWTNKYEVKVAR